MSYSNSIYGLVPLSNDAFKKMLESGELILAIDEDSEQKENFEGIVTTNINPVPAKVETNLSERQVSLLSNINKDNHFIILEDDEPFIKRIKTYLNDTKESINKRFLDQKSKQLKKYEAEKNSINKTKFYKLNKANESLKEDLSELDKNISSHQKLINDYEVKIKTFKNKLFASKSKIESLKSEKKNVQDALGALIESRKQFKESFDLECQRINIEADCLLDNLEKDNRIVIKQIEIKEQVELVKSTSRLTGMLSNNDNKDFA